MTGRAGCTGFREALALLAGRDLDVVEARSVWRHLAACPSCRRDYASCLETGRLLRTMRPPAAEVEGPEARFFAALEADTLRAVAADAAAGSPSRGRWWLGAAAFVVGIGIAAGGWLGSAAEPDGHDVLLRREPLPAVEPVPVGTALKPLSHPQGLEAQRQLPLLFEWRRGGVLVGEPTLDWEPTQER